MDKELLSITDIAKRLAIPESNLRYYRDKFDKFIPSEGDGRKKRYCAEAIEIFKTIAKGMGKGQSETEIAEQLRSEFPQPVTAVDEIETTATTATTKTQQTLEAVLFIITKYEKRITDLERREREREIALTSLNLEFEDHIRMVDKRLSASNR